MLPGKPENLPQFFAAVTIALGIAVAVVAVGWGIALPLFHYLSGLTTMAYLAALAAWIDSGIDVVALLIQE